MHEHFPIGACLKNTGCASTNQFVLSKTVSNKSTQRIKQIIKLVLWFYVQQPTILIHQVFRSKCMSNFQSEHVWFRQNTERDVLLFKAVSAPTNHVFKRQIYSTKQIKHQMSTCLLRWAKTIAIHQVFRSKCMSTFQSEHVWKTRDALVHTNLSCLKQKSNSAQQPTRFLSNKSTQRIKYSIKRVL